MKKLLLISALSLSIMASSVTGFAKTNLKPAFPNLGGNFVFASAPTQDNNEQTLEQKKADILKKVTDKIDNKVKEGKMTRSEADKKLTDFKSILDKWDGTGEFHDYFRNVKKEEFQKLPLDEKKSVISERFNKRIEKAVEENKITQDQAAKMKQDLKKALDKWDGTSKLEFNYDKNIFGHHHCPDGENNCQDKENNENSENNESQSQE